MFGLGASNDHDDLLWAGAATYVMGGPVVHFANQRPDAGAGSFFLRLGLPVTGLAIGAASSSGWGAFAYGAFGAITGATLASIIDIAALGWKRVERPPGASTIGFDAVPVRGGMTAGVSGTF
ncbi:hypothetical protein [Pendulispora albinea]|uniref:Uncharacterized protein n=1 Tax=Pendulispora albinea TaxID=2741071 RepID=A0ABZ2LQ52_9BACT